MRLLLASILVFCLSVTSVSFGHDYRMEKVRDLVYMRAKPWLQVQGKPGWDRSSMNLLIALTQGVKLDPEFATELEEEWFQVNHRDQQDAINWCERQALRGAHPSEIWWNSRVEAARNSDYSFTGGFYPSFDDMRRWAYYWRYYGAEGDAPPEQLAISQSKLPLQFTCQEHSRVQH